jgi:MYXO-CTERM domain-containing protein
MPVDQTEEQVLFVRDGNITETHIRVVYEGDVENFAWVIPLTAEDTPAFSVGSDALFTRLDQDSRPNYSLTNIGGEEACNDWGTGTSGDSGGAFVALDSASGPPDVEIEGTVGSFEFAVLSGGTPESVMQWLSDNGYEQDPAAEPILADYLDEGAKLAAVKLAADADNDAIHPIVIRYTGAGPCVPIRLTAIAAEDDMGIRLFALDDERLVPLTYEHVSPNLLRLEDWSWENYEELVTLAVDEAGGRAFATEYVGDSNIVQDWGIHENSWDSSVFVDIEPHLVTQMLQSQGFMGQPLLASIMREFLPAPDGLSENDFWNNLDEYASLIDMQAWSGPGFAAKLEAMIIAPGAHAGELLDTRPLLSRLFTTISPHEMVEDPLFFYRGDLPEVSRQHDATRESECDELGVWTVEGHEICETEYDTWPTIDSMAWARRVERIPTVGAPQTVFDHDAAIALQVEAHNEMACDGVPSPGTTGTSSGGSGGGSGSGTGGGGLDTGSEETTAGLDGAGSGKSGCSCSSDADGGLGLLGMLGLLGLRLRRRGDAVGR